MAYRVFFYRTPAGNEPVREWLRDLPKEARHALGADLMTVQYRWPLGMPLVRKLAPGLWEVRSTIPDGIARVFFTVSEETIVALHGCIKKSQKTPATDLATAIRRRDDFTRSNA